jgi:hypothetical protein
VQGVMGAKNVLNDAATRFLVHIDAGFCINEKSLAADGAVNSGGDFGLAVWRHDGLLSCFAISLSVRFLRVANLTVSIVSLGGLHWNGQSREGGYNEWGRQVGAVRAKEICW